MAGVTEKRRRACAAVLGFDRNAITFNKRTVQNSVDRLLHDAFGLINAGVFLRNYAERLALGDLHAHHRDLDNDLVQFHRILGYGVDLGFPDDLYNEEIARRVDTIFGAFNVDESSDEDEEEEEQEEEEEEQEQEQEQEEEEEEENADAVRQADYALEDKEVADNEEEDNEEVGEEDVEGSSGGHTQPFNPQRQKKRTLMGASKSQPKRNRELADLRKSDARLGYSTRNADFLRTGLRGGCPRESDLDPRDARLKQHEYIIRKSAGSGSGKTPQEGRGTADLRECDIVDTPMKIEDFQEFKSSWEKDAEWLRKEAEETGCFSSGDTTNYYISFMSIYPLAIVDEYEDHCGLKALGSLFRPPSHCPSVSEVSVLQSTIIKTPVFRFLVNNVVEVSVCDD